MTKETAAKAKNGEMRGIGALRVLGSHLDAIAFPHLSRPDDTVEMPKSKGIVQWGICVYVYSVISHLRMMVRGLLLLGVDGNSPATAPIARNVFEWTAATCFLTEKMRVHLENDNWDGAWGTLSSFMVGSGWIKRYGTLYPEFGIKPRDVLVPPGTTKLVASYQRFFEKQGYKMDACEEYSHLCDNSHTTSVVLARYRNRPTSPNITTFKLNLEEERAASFLPIANVNLLHAFLFFDTLLDCAEEVVVRPALVAALRAGMDWQSS